MPPKDTLQEAISEASNFEKEHEEQKLLRGEASGARGAGAPDKRILQVQSETVKPTCQYCSKIGHTARDCRKLRGVQPQSLPSTTEGVKREDRTAANTNRRSCFYCRKTKRLIPDCRERIFNKARRPQINQDNRASNVQGTNVPGNRGFMQTRNCYYCGAPGHFARDCRRGPPAQNQTGSRSQSQQVQRAQGDPHNFQVQGNQG